MRLGDFVVTFSPPPPHIRYRCGQEESADLSSIPITNVVVTALHLSHSAIASPPSLLLSSLSFVTHGDLGKKGRGGEGGGKNAWDDEGAL